MTNLIPMLSNSAGALVALAGLGDALTDFALTLMWLGLYFLWLMVFLTTVLRSRFLFFVTFGYLILYSILFRPWNAFSVQPDMQMYYSEEVESFQLVRSWWLGTIVLWLLSGISCWVDWQRWIWPPLEDKDDSPVEPHSEFLLDADGYVYQHVGDPGDFFLKIALRDEHTDDIHVTRLSQEHFREFAPLPREAVRLAVQNGVAKANKQFETTYQVARIWYREADTPFLAIYQHAAEMIIEQLSLDADSFQRSVPVS